jgi:hypothetical protein
LRASCVIPRRRVYPRLYLAARRVNVADVHDAADLAAVLLHFNRLARHAVYQVLDRLAVRRPRVNALAIFFVKVPKRQSKFRVEQLVATSQPRWILSLVGVLLPVSRRRFS